METVEDEHRPAFWAAYNTLTQHGVAHAEIRGDVAAKVVRVLVRQRDYHGMGYMLVLVQCTAAVRERHVNRVMLGQPAEWTSVTPAAVDAALSAAARVLAEG